MHILHTILCSDKENLLNNQELFFVSDHFLYSHDLYV